MTIFAENMNLEALNIPMPPGSKEHPLKRSVRLVDPKANPTMIIGLPKQIASMADIEKGTELMVWMEVVNGKTRVIYEKVD
jgi:hypothetical protein